jgi:hypothetical protein
VPKYTKYSFGGPSLFSAADAAATKTPHIHNSPTAGSKGFIRATQQPMQPSDQSDFGRKAVEKLKL